MNEKDEPNRIFKLRGTFIAATQHFLGLDDSFYRDSSREAAQEQIDKDLPRERFFSRKHSITEMQKRWREKNITNSFTQGGMDGRFFSEMFAKLSGPQGLIPMQALHQDNNKGLSFAYIDEKGRDCGFALHYLANNPSFFTLTQIKNTSLPPEARVVTVYQGTATAEGFARLRELIPEAARSEGEFVERSTLKEELLTDETLPPEVRGLLEDIINPDGSINTELVAHYEQAIIGNRDNRGVAVGDERLAEEDLLMYKAFCLAARQQLKPLDTQEAEDLARQIRKTLNNINQAIDSKDPKTYLKISEDIKQEVLGHLKQAGLSQPMLEALANESLLERRGESLLTSSALTLLMVGAAALTATGVASPIGLALAAAVAVTLAVASVVSWSITAYKEHKLSEAREELSELKERPDDASEFTQHFKDNIPHDEAGEADEADEEEEPLLRGPS